MNGINVTATAVFIFFFALVTILGFVAARWKAGDLNELHEWGLGGRRFGSWITWFLLGGDLYTAYTVIAVPAVVYAIGAYGFFAVPYTILIYPFIFLTMPRLWNATHKRGYLTGADFVYGAYGNKWLEGMVALTGIIATMPYIALQLVGMEKVIQALGFPHEGMAGHLPLTIAFLILAVYTYRSGLRAPAMIAFVKDIMIYIFVIAAVIIIPAKLGGYGAIFDSAQKDFSAQLATNPNVARGILLAPSQIWPFVTLAIGSAMALFMYPHSLTGVLSASGPKAIRHNAISLPAYSLVLALIAMLGYMAHAAGIKVDNPQDAVPQLFLAMFPSWFVGFTFAAIAIGALVPAAVMSIGAANTFTRNLWRPFINENMSPSQESALAKLMSLVVKIGALIVIIFLPTQFALDLQLLGGVWMIQIFPAIIFGLYTRWYKGGALLAGLIVGLALGTYLSYGPASWVPVSKAFLGIPLYNGLTAVIANVIVATLLSFVLPANKSDELTEADFRDARA
ncbi:monocarboxylate uptake permease MctP [Rhizobium sp. C4]|uniref:monocarboxylate uptake permease MctP n=1 Tax=Rhizobium sp. C4 TaxID=1349800 RepID=UPI001E6026C7|nr:sodium:solute symporter family protein [Rhizobium sp. C4]MCD2175847.1 sodium:solute symporter family protein [Rhizobium sp. C4]